MTEYELTWRAKMLTVASLGINNLDDLIEHVEAAARELREMRDAGVRMAEHSAVADDYVFLTTEDPAIAAKFGFTEMMGAEE